jgi:hypothetical protein
VGRAGSREEGEVHLKETKKSFWERLFDGSYRSEQEEKVLDYIIHRLKAGAEVREVVEESYVRRNCSRDEIEAIVARPELVHAAREQLEYDFGSGLLNPAAARGFEGDRNREL